MVANSPEPPDSPSRRCSRTLKCESIRSLRGLLQASLSSVSLADLVDEEGNKQQGVALQSPADDSGENTNTSDEDQKKTSNDEENSLGEPLAVKSASVTATKIQVSRRAADEMRYRLLQNLGIDKQQQQQQQQRLQQQRQQATASSGAANASAGTTVTPPPSGNNSEPWGPSYTVSLNDVPENTLEAPSPESDAATTPEGPNPLNTNNTDSASSGVSGGANDDPPSKRTTTTTNKLRFHDTVTVHPIPSFKVYSSRIRDTIWTGSYELHENVARNSLEFSYEDWDPDHVLDEDTGLIYIPPSQPPGGKHGNKNNGNNHNNCGQWVHPVHYGAPSRDMGTPLASDDIWEYTCQQKLGIPTAETFHSLPSIVKKD